MRRLRNRTVTGTRSTVRLLAIALLLVAPTFAKHETTFELRVGSDRPDALYALGEEAHFTIQVLDGGSPVPAAHVEYSVDDFIADTAQKWPAGAAQIGADSLRIAVASTVPVFLRCRVSYVSPDGDTMRAAAGVGFAPGEIGLSLPVPEDFDEFWAGQKRRLAEVPMEATLTPVPGESQNVKLFDLQVTCAGDAPVSGYLAVPEGARPASLPAILWVQGAGIRSSERETALHGANAGMLSLEINAHGIANGQPDEFYAELHRGALKGYPKLGSHDRDQSYFVGMFLRLQRAMDYLTSRPEWDGRVLAVVGHSQGGAQALAASGLDERVTFVGVGVPAMCDHSGRVADRINGWPKLVPTLDDGELDPAILQASRYVDAVNFATRSQAEAIFSVGYVDGVCPPSSVYAAFNALPGPKQIIDEPLMGHAAPEHIQDAFFAALEAHVAARR